MFENDSSEGRTARSFGGLRMTEKVGDSHRSEASGRHSQWILSRKEMLNSITLG
jgi:hypothetical protein